MCPKDLTQKRFLDLRLNFCIVHIHTNRLFVTYFRKSSPKLPVAYALSKLSSEIWPTTNVTSDPFITRKKTLHEKAELIYLPVSGSISSGEGVTPGGVAVTTRRTRPRGMEATCCSTSDCVTPARSLPFSDIT